MKRLQAYKFVVEPNGEQVRSMRRFAGSRRFVFNKALALQKERYANGLKKLGYTALCEELVKWKAQPETSWLSETHSQVLQQSLKDLERAYTNCFEGRAAFPTYKKKGNSNNFRFPQGFKIDQPNHRIFLPKLGWINYRNSRDILGTPKNVTVSCVADKWFVSIQTEREVEQPVHPSISIVGIDLGIARFATLSDGSFVEPLNSFRKHEQRLARCQRAMSKKKKFSSNWKKAKAKVSKLHTKIGNVRRDFLHKLTTTISKNHAIVVVENLQVLNMSKSAAGSVNDPGRHVRQKSGLNKAILDQGWFEFRRQLEYKQVWMGGDVFAVPPHNSSRTCPACEHVSAQNRRTQAKFECVECGYENHADLVGAINVLERGHRLLACGESVQSGRSVKQEPTEAVHGTM